MRRCSLVLPALLPALLLLVLAALAGPRSSTPITAGPGTGTVVVLGVGGLRWSDVGPQTPTLAALAARGASGALSIKALPRVTCQADGWLTLGAGTRARAFATAPDESADDRCGTPRLVPADEQARRNADTLDGARTGALGQVLGPRAVAVGEGARLALGRDSTTAAPPGRSGLRLVDLGQLPLGDDRQALRRLDGRLADELAALPPDADVLVVGVSEPHADGTPDLAVAVAAGPSFPRGALRSPSTRRAPYVQLVDVGPTVLTLLGEPVPDVMDGEPWQVAGPAPSVAALTDLERRAGAAAQVTVPFYVGLVAGLLALLLALRRRRAALRVVALSGTAALGVSYLAQLVPWWRAPAPLLVLGLLVAVGSVAVALVGRTVAGVCGVVVAVLVTDLVTGARLQVDAVAGYSPLVAGRFAGLGNVAFGVYATAFLLLTAARAAGRPARRATAVVAGLGAPAVVVVGAPPWGSDVGGVLALLPSFVLLALLVTGRRVTALPLLAAGAAAAAGVTLLALLDLARPAAERTHLGRFAADVRDGTAGELLVRKAVSGPALLLSGPLTAALPLVVAGAGWLLLHPPPALRAALADVPGLRPGLLAVGAVSALGWLVNDSGAAVPAMALLVAVPATVAVLAAQATRPSSAPPSAARAAPVD